MPNTDIKKIFPNLEKNGLSQANVLWGDTIWKEKCRQKAAVGSILSAVFIYAALPIRTETALEI